MQAFHRVKKFFERISDAPEEVRRGWGTLLLLFSLPFVLGVWWLTFRMSSSSGTPGALSAVFRQWNESVAQIMRGFANTRAAFDALQKEIMDAGDRDTKEEVRTQLSLPIVE